MENKKETTAEKPIMFEGEVKERVKGKGESEAQSQRADASG